MLKRFYRTLFTLLGMICGVGIAFLLNFVLRQILSKDELSSLTSMLVLFVCIIVTGLIFFLIAPAIQRSIQRMAQELELYVQKIPTQEFVSGMIGLLVGLIIAYLVSDLWKELQIPVLGTVLSVLVYIFMGYIGIYIGAKKGSDMANAIKNTVGRGPSVARSQTRTKHKDISPKILDTSVIIDGRIADIMKTGFIEGKIVIPEFVLVELRHIADSSDSLKRNRGRRGLDILNKIQTTYGVDIYNTDSQKAVNAAQEVDVKLLELAAAIGGKVVTNDYNLNKVASIKGVPVLNINELANTLKPVVLPGEEMEVTPVKEGKEHNQALAYLDDGTMIVVEEGRHLIDQDITVVVTSVLQTAAGRMIFAKPKHSKN